MARAVLSAYIESCAWLVTQTDVQTVTQTIQSFDITVVITTIYSVEVTVILDRVLSFACPGQPACGGQGRGRCIAGRCACEQGSSTALTFCFLTIVYISYIS